MKINDWLKTYDEPELRTNNRIASQEINQ